MGLFYRQEGENQRKTFLTPFSNLTPSRKTFLTPDPFF